MAENRIIIIDDMRPHINVVGKSGVHVCPVAMFEKIVSGELKSADIEDIDDFLPTIIFEWLHYVGA